MGVFKIIAGLTDSQKTTTFDFRVEIFNEPPYFLTNPRDQVVILGNSEEYTLPEAADAEFLPVKYSVKWLNGKMLEPLPSFINFENKVFKFKPNNEKDIGEH